MDNTLQSIENLPSENDENEPLLEFRFQARNMSVDWRKLSLIDVDAIAASMDIDQLQEYLKVVMEREKSKAAKKDDKIRLLDSDKDKLKAELLQVKKENKKRRRMIEEYQRMMEVGANSFYKCPICPSKSFINATYLQSHMHRKHQEHTTYIGDAILHTKAITQNVQEKLISVQDQIELEKRRNEELQLKRVEEQKRAEEKIFEQQEHIQRLERTRYEAKLKELELSFQTEIDMVKSKERNYIERINELEEKSAKLARTESMVKSLQAEIPKIEDHVHTKLDDLETSLRHQQSVLADQIKDVPKSPPRQRSVVKSPKKSVAYRENPIDVEAEREAERQRLIDQFRPSMINLLNAKLEELGIANQVGLTENMYKMKREDLRNSRAHKIGSIANFHLFRNDIENVLENRISDVQQAPQPNNGFNISNADQRVSSKPTRPMSGPPMQTLKRKPKRPANPPSPQPVAQPNSLSNRQQFNTSIQSSPGKPHFASTMKTPSSNPARQSAEVASSSDWADSERQPPRKPMTEFHEKVVESVDTIAEKTEEDQTSAWSDESEDFSVGQSVKKKADQIESQLAARTGAKPVGGHDLTGIQDQTNMAVDELFDDDSELETK